MKGKKEGKGSFLCKMTENFYHGSFNNDAKNGYGIMFFGKNNDIKLSLVENINSNKTEENKVKMLVYKG